MTTWADVVVLGLGPAGRATTSACVRLGLDVLVLDPAPHRRWTATYGAWSDELAPEAPVAVQFDNPVAWTTRRHELGRAYTVLDTAALQDGLDLTGVRVRSGRAVWVERADGYRRVECADGEVLRARLVLDARGAPVSGRAQQTAHGVVVEAGRAQRLLDGAEALFMDWRPADDPRAAPSFLYALPLGGDRVLLEETCLAGRPALGTGELHRRLQVRLARHGVELRGDEPVERVRFALDTPLPPAEWLGRAPTAPRIGAAAPVVHPATGYSVAASLRLAPEIAAAARADDPARAVQDVLWPAGARAVHGLRRRGLEVLLGLAPEQVPQFFAAFLDLPAHHQRSYLSDRAHPGRTAAAMTALLPHLSGPLRTALLTRAVGLGPRATPRPPVGR
jgi:lycopene beta-cyclase